MLKITTPCFVEGGWIPDHNAGFGEDQSPEFHIVFSFSNDVFR